jgi:hypothetical protein
MPFENVRRAEKAYRDLYSHLVDIYDKADGAENKNETEMSIMGECTTFLAST